MRQGWGRQGRVGPGLIGLARGVDRIRKKGHLHVENAHVSCWIGGMVMVGRERRRFEKGFSSQTRYTWKAMPVQTRIRFD